MDLIFYIATKKLSEKDKARLIAASETIALTLLRNLDIKCNIHMKSTLLAVTTVCKDSPSFLIVGLGMTATKKIAAHTKMPIWNIKHPRRLTDNEQAAEVKKLCDYLIIELKGDDGNGD